MRNQDEIKEKISEIQGILLSRKKRRKKPNPERLDILSALHEILEKGKFGTLHKWDERKRGIKKMNEQKDIYGRKAHWHKNLWGNKVPSDELDSEAWKVSTYSWALKMRDPDEAKIVQQLRNIVKEKIKKKKKKK